MYFENRPTFSPFFKDFFPRYRLKADKYLSLWRQPVAPAEDPQVSEHENKTKRRLTLAFIVS